ETGSPLVKELENVEDVTILDDHTVSFTLKQPVAVPEVYFLAMPILPAHKFSVLEPSLEEVPDLEKPREGRVHNVSLRSEPKADVRLVDKLPIGVQLEALEAAKGWVHVRVIGKGPVGREGWIEQHVPVISVKISPDFLVSPVGTGPYRF